MEREHPHDVVPSKEAASMLLAGDIGGTKTSLALYASADDLRMPLAEANFPRARYAGLEAMVDEFLAPARGRVERASFGGAGPVGRGEGRVTNLARARGVGGLGGAAGGTRVGVAEGLG